jgi:hypothetical protein
MYVNELNSYFLFSAKRPCVTPSTPTKFTRRRSLRVTITVGVKTTTPRHAERPSPLLARESKHDEHCWRSQQPFVMLSDRAAFGEGVEACTMSPFDSHKVHAQKVAQGDEHDWRSPQPFVMLSDRARFWRGSRSMSCVTPSTPTKFTRRRSLRVTITVGVKTTTPRHAERPSPLLARESKHDEHCWRSQQPFVMLSDRAASGEGVEACTVSPPPASDGSPGRAGFNSHKVHAQKVAQGDEPSCVKPQHPVMLSDRAAFGEEVEA